jgi:hypothetical protein
MWCLNIANFWLLGVLFVLIYAEREPVEFVRTNTNAADDLKASTKTLQMRGAAVNYTSTSSISTASFGEVSAARLAAARQLVSSAIEKAIVANTARYDNPKRNFRAGSSQGQQQVPALFRPSQEIREAAALIAEVEALKDNPVKSRRGLFTNSTQNLPLKTSFWMEDLVHQGTQPFGDDPIIK